MLNNLGLAETTTPQLVTPRSEFYQSPGIDYWGSLDRLAPSQFTNDHDDIGGNTHIQLDFQAQLQRLKQIIRDWLHSHHESLKEAYLQTTPQLQTLVVVMHGRQYDEQLEESLTNLTIEIANDPRLDKIKLDVQCLPQCDKDDVQSFIAIGGE